MAFLESVFLPKYESEIVEVMSEHSAFYSRTDADIECLFEKSFTLVVSKSCKK